MLNYKPHYGFLSILGFNPKIHKEKKRRRGTYHLKIGTHPPGCGALDKFQFGRDKSVTNNYIIFDIGFYKNDYKGDVFISRYSFTIVGHADTATAYLFSGGLNAKGEFKDSKNPILLKYPEEMNYVTVPKLPTNLSSVNFLELTCELKDKSLINIGGTTLFWKSFSVQIPEEWIKKVEAKNNELPDDEKLILSTNRIFHMDFTGPLFKFCGCQHVVSRKTAEFWAGQIVIHGRTSYVACCPFCDDELDGIPGFVEVT